METFRDWIIKTAKETEVSYRNLLALAPQNDPFYVGSEKHMDMANWVAKLYQIMGAPPTVYIRRMHYYFFSKEKVLKPDGKPYSNTDSDWDYMALACKYARYLGTVPMDVFVDRRNPNPTINARYWDNEDIQDRIDDISAREVAKIVSQSFLIYNQQLAQPYHIELWNEKSAVLDITSPIARRFYVNEVWGLGELSITQVNLLMKRIMTANKPVRIFYISDHDGAGDSMPVAISRKIEFLVRSEPNNLDIKLKPAILTEEQCKQYNLPKKPIKAKATRQGDAYRARFGGKFKEGITELDALESVVPGEMAKILEANISPYFDTNIQRKVQKQNEKIQQAVFDAIMEREYDLKQVLSDIDLSESKKIDDEFEMPTGQQIPEDDDWLYDSARSYIDQIKRYKAHQR